MAIPVAPAKGNRQDTHTHTGRARPMTLAELFSLLRKHLRFVLLLPIITGVVVAIAAFLMPNEYTASTTMYVLSRNDTTEGTSSNSQYSDLSAAQMMTQDVATIAESDRVKQDVSKQLGMSSLSGYDVEVTSATTTRVLTIAVTGKDAKRSADIANAYASDLQSVTESVIGTQSVNVIDQASTPEAPSGPRRPLYIAVGLLAGLFAAIVIVVVQDMMDTRVKSSEDVEQLLNVPVVGHFPQLERM